MSKTGRTYVVVKWNPGFDRSGFARAKAQGLLQTSYDSVRKNIAGDRALLKWRGTKPAEISPGLIVWQGTHQEMLAYFEANRAEWIPSLPAVRTVSRTAFISMDSNTRPDVAQPKKTSAWKWAAGAAIAAAAAGAAYQYFA